MKVVGFDFVFRPQPTIYLLWALGDEGTRLAIEAAHERAIERVLEWIEDHVAVIRSGKDGVYRVRPPGGRVAAPCSEARVGCSRGRKTWTRMLCVARAGRSRRSPGI